MRVEELHTSPVIPRVQTRLQLCAMAGRVHPVPRQYEVLTDRAEAREKRVRRG